jgi:hypothetical protein
MKKILTFIALITASFLAVVSSVQAVTLTDVKVTAETGEIAYIPTCSWSYPEGFYTKTSTYTYLGRIPVSEPSSKYPGTWQCDYVVKNMIRINNTTLWSPLSSKYGSLPESNRVRSGGIDPANAGAGFVWDQYFQLRGVQVLNHFYDDVSIAYQTTSYTSFTLKKVTSGTAVLVNPASINYSVNTTRKCLGGNDDRVNCRWIHKFNTTNLSTGTYRIDFTDTNTGGAGASKGGSYQIFFYLTR